jgi:hypothetical protein
VADIEFEHSRRSYENANGDWVSIGQFDTAVSVADLWPVLSCPARWPSWWYEVARVRIADGAFEPGRGTIRFRRLPPLPVKVASAAPGTRVTVHVSTGPLLMDIELMLVEVTPGLTRIIERITIIGPGARFAGRIYHRCRGERFAPSMTRLISLASSAADASDAQAEQAAPSS